MKNVIMLFLVITLFGTSCRDKNNIETTIDPAKESVDVRSVRIKGEIDYDANPKLKSLLKNPEKHTWEELDSFYWKIALKNID